MNITEQINELRSNGWLVSTKHFRPLKNNRKLCVPYNRHTKKGDTIETCGGSTEVTLSFSPDGVKFVGTAECGDRDSFNYKIGRKIALHRAMVNAALKSPSRQVTEVYVGGYVEMVGDDPKEWKNAIINYYDKMSEEEIRRLVTRCYHLEGVGDEFVNAVLKGEE